jgi:hypothetical protein
MVGYVIKTDSGPVTDVKKRRASLVNGWITAVKKTCLPVTTKTPRVVYNAESLTPKYL